MNHPLRNWRQIEVINKAGDTVACLRFTIEEDILTVAAHTMDIEGKEYMAGGYVLGDNMLRFSLTSGKVTNIPKKRK